MNGFKKVAILGLVLVLLTGLAGCDFISEQFEEDEPDDPTDTDPAVTEIILERIEIEEHEETEAGQKQYLISAVVENQDEIEDDLHYEWEIDEGEWAEYRDEGEQFIENQGESQIIYTTPDVPEGVLENVPEVEVSITAESDQYDPVSSEPHAIVVPPEIGSIRIEDSEGEEIQEIEVGDRINIRLDVDEEDIEDLNFTWFIKLGDEAEEELPAADRHEITGFEIERNVIHEFRVEVEDEYSNIYEEDYIFEVGMAKPEINDIDFTPAKDEIHEKTDSVTIDVDAVDPEGDDEELEYSWIRGAEVVEENQSYITLEDLPGEGDSVQLTLEIEGEEGEIKYRDIEFEINPVPVDLDEIVVSPAVPEVGENARLEAWFEGADDLEFNWSYSKVDDDVEGTIDSDEPVAEFPAMDDPGTYRVEVWVIDPDGDRIEQETNVTVKASDPRIENLTITPSREVELEDEIRIKADGYDPEYNWDDLDFNWNVDAPAEIIEGQDTDEITVESEQPGSFIVSLTVTNEHLGEDSWSDTIEVTSTPPNILGISVYAEDVADMDEEEFDEDEIEIYNDDIIRLEAEAEDPDGYDLDFSWRRGYTELGTGEEISYQPYEDNMMPTNDPAVELVVEDQHGATSQETAVSIDLKNRAPEIEEIVAHERIQAGEEQSFYVVASDPDGEEDLEDFSWEADIGEIPFSESQTVSYEAPVSSGDEKITVTVEDGSGASDTETKDIVITEDELVINTMYAITDLVPAGESTDIIVEVSDPEEAELEYNWNAEEGNIVGEGERVEYEAPGDPGDDVITVTVEDPDTDRSVSDSIEIEVELLLRESYDSDIFHAGIEWEGGFALAGQDGEQAALTRTDFRLREEDFDDYVRFDESSIKDIIEIDTGYFLAGESGDHGLIFAVDQDLELKSDQEWYPADNINAVMETDSEEYVIVGDENNQGYIAWIYGAELSSDERETDEEELTQADSLHAAAETETGIIVAGEQNHNGFVASVDSEGNVEWQEEFTQKGRFMDIVRTAENDYVMVTDDGEIVTIDEEGSEQWASSAGAELNAVIESGEGFVAVGEANNDAFVVNIDDVGDIEWDQQFSGGHFSDVIQDRNGYILVGTDGLNAFAARIDDEGNKAD